MARKNKYQIDQSIKIENTNRATYVAIANGTSCICSISAKEKNTLKKYYRKLKKPLIFKLFTFSVLCAKVIANTSAKNIIIDIEYLGHENNIKSYIIQLLNIWKTKGVIINFEKIGKSSSAHDVAYNAYKSKKVDTRVDSKEVIVLYKMINKA